MKLDKRTIKILFGIVAFGVGLAFLLQNLPEAWNVVKFLWGLIWPFILGLILAFLLNIPMRAIEKLLFRGKKSRGRRVVSFMVSFVIVLGVLALASWLVVPQLVDTIATLIKAMPGYVQNLQDMIRPYEQYVPMLQEVVDWLNLDWSQISKEALALVQSGAGSVFTSAWGFASGLVSGTVSFFIGLIFAIYVLLDKERLHRQFTGLLLAYIPQKRYDKFIDVARLIDRTFTGFVSGSCLEALALTVIFSLLLTIMGYPYALLIGVLIGLFSFIPIFGSTVACVIGALLILMARGFWPAIIFVIVFLVVQQLDGNFMYPHIVGNSVGLPPIWVLVAVTVGASVMGIAGMLLFIPMGSVIYTLLKRDAKARLEAKGIVVSEEEPPPAPKKQGFFARRKAKKAAKEAVQETEMTPQEATEEQQPAPEAEMPVPAKPQKRTAKKKPPQKT